MNICPDCSKEHCDDRRKVCGACRIRRSRRKTKEKAVAKLGGKCVRCSYDKSLRALEFHHIDPEQKDIQISMSKNNAWEKIEKELEKCILVCSNCHAEIHEEIEKEKRALQTNRVEVLV